MFHSASFRFILSSFRFISYSFRFISSSFRFISLHFAPFRFISYFSRTGWHNHTVSTPSNTEVCLCKQALRRRKHWLLVQKISNCFDFTQAACASTQTTPYTVKQFAQTLCLRKLLARVGAASQHCRQF